MSKEAIWHEHQKLERKRGHSNAIKNTLKTSAAGQASTASVRPMRKRRITGRRGPAEGIAVGTRPADLNIRALTSKKIGIRDVSRLAGTLAPPGPKVMMPSGFAGAE